MSMLMLLLARAYAPLGARGALIEGLPLRGPTPASEAKPRPATPCASFPAQARRALHARVAHTRDERDSLAA